MHWALAFLGLPDDADARAVRRAYAARLRTTRPDEDADGFQRLHQAYQQALEWVALPLAERRAEWNDWDDDIHADDIRDDRHDADDGDARAQLDAGADLNLDAHHADAQPANPARAEHADARAAARSNHTDDAEDADGEPDVVSRHRIRMPAPGLQPSLALSRPIGWSPAHDAEQARTPEMSAAERDAFFWTLHQHANRLPAAAFRDWLHAQPALYPLGVKDGMALPLALFLDGAEPIGYKQLMITLHFFGLDTVSRTTLAVQEPLHRIQLKAFRDGDDPRADQIDAELGQRERTGSGGGSTGGAWAVWGGILLFSVLARCVNAAMN